MQGGHGEGIRFQFRGTSAKDYSSDTSSDAGSEVSIEEPIRLGHKLDTIVLLLRESFGNLLALPVAWIQFHSSVQSLRLHKLRRIESGVHTILWIQSYRNPLFDFIMQAFSFCAEEEFYLVVLPLLFWNGFFELAVQLTLIVVCGLFVGNIVKDIFELPRPTGVWRPSLNLDSTHLQDFGFPSTHAMNAVTNALLVLWYFHGTVFALLPSCLALMYIALLSLSRLYLGAHTGTDIRGGWGLGVIVFGVFWFLHPWIETVWLTSSLFGATLACFLLVSISLLLCPQPRPITPTFHQNALLAGLFAGLIVGRKLFVAFSDMATNESYTGTVFFNVFGFVCMLVVRAVVKTGTVLLLEHGMGVQTKPREEVLHVRSKTSKRKRVIRLFTRDVDIVAIAVIKVLTYFASALWITFGAPYAWHCLMKAAV